MGKRGGKQKELFFCFAPKFMVEFSGFVYGLRKDSRLLQSFKHKAEIWRKMASAPPPSQDWPQVAQEDPKMAQDGAPEWSVQVSRPDPKERSS